MHFFLLAYQVGTGSRTLSHLRWDDLQCRAGRGSGPQDGGRPRAAHCPGDLALPRRAGTAVERCRVAGSGSASGPYRTARRCGESRRGVAITPSPRERWSFRPPVAPSPRCATVSEGDSCPVGAALTRRVGPAGPGARTGKIGCVFTQKYTRVHAALLERLSGICCTVPQNR